MAKSAETSSETRAFWSSARIQRGFEQRLFTVPRGQPLPGDKDVICGTSHTSNQVHGILGVDVNIDHLSAFIWEKDEAVRQIVRRSTIEVVICSRIYFECPLWMIDTDMEHHDYQKAIAEYDHATVGSRPTVKRPFKLNVPLAVARRDTFEVRLRAPDEDFSSIVTVAVLGDSLRDIR